MSDMLDYFADEMKNTYSVYPKESTLDADDEVIEGFVGNPTLRNIKCAYYTGSAAEALIADRYKTTATGVIVSKVVTVPDGSKVVLDNGEEFLAVHADDVMNQGEVLVITLQTVDYGTAL